MALNNTRVGVANMTRVLVINSGSTKKHGLFMVLLNYAKLTQHAVDYDFALNERVEPECCDLLSRCGKNVYVSPYSRMKKPLSYMRWLTRLMRENKYDVVHVHGSSATVYIETRAAQKARIPIRVVHSHNSSSMYSSLLHKVLKPFLNRALTRPIACSNEAGRWLFTGDFTVLQNAIKTEKFIYNPEVRAAYRERLALEGKFVIGHVAHMFAVKNHIYLLRVFQELIKREPNTRLLLIGTGELRPKIEKFIDEAELNDYVQLLGLRDDVAELYQCMDAFVLPSHFEGLPLTLIEAQTAGLPCLVSEYVTRDAKALESTKFIGIEDADVERWVESLLNVKNNEQDRSASAKIMLESGWNIENCAEALLNIYKDA